MTLFKILRKTGQQVGFIFKITYSFKPYTDLSSTILIPLPHITLGLYRASAFMSTVQIIITHTGLHSGSLC